MDAGNVVAIVFVVIFVAIFAARFRAARRDSRRASESAARSEAMFQSMFPELQPHYHPLKLLDFVRARRSRSARRGVWKNPPGFATESAETTLEDGKERVRLRDAAGAVVGEFVFEEHAEGGVLRVGKGKLTVNTQDVASPRVRYWHPDREFKWKRGQWTFQSRMADREIESSSDSSSSFSSDSSSTSSSGAARTAAAAAGIAAAGGAFDGGGASTGFEGDADGGSGGSASAAPAY